MSVQQYRNPWIPQAALDILAAERGPILDVGGGAAPFAGASHVLDLIPFDQNRLVANAWGGSRFSPWTSAEYTEFDICGRNPWPFADKAFALGLCSHTLEDLRDPLPALTQLGRICERLLIITPSRLLEQTKNIDHPRFCGFAHHPWMVFCDEGGLVFRRKTAYLNFPGCHFRCPVRRTLPIDRGTFMYHGVGIPGRELAYWSAEEEIEDYKRFVREQGSTDGLFVPARRPLTFKRWVYHLKQRFLGVA